MSAGLDPQNQATIRRHLMTRAGRDDLDAAVWGTLNGGELLADLGIPETPERLRDLDRIINDALTMEA